MELLLGIAALAFIIAVLVFLCVLAEKIRRDIHPGSKPWMGIVVVVYTLMMVGAVVWRLHASVETRPVAVIMTATEYLLYFGVINLASYAVLALVPDD